MTDEERADEYASSYGDDNIIDFGDDQLNLFPLRRWSFLDGLKAGKDMNVPTKWHDLRKDPNDLPNCAHGHTVFDQDLDRVIIRNGRFEFLDGCIAHVIAWCEIPKFKEE